ncbi:MAG: hypothetical protein IT214_07135 [Chitinophagaceae bacterium]|jgi:transcription elongation factor Elf1|nr:hypothetical protein [Chitinophagaceae bacterium]OQY96584.1 MAG: hypothetical protein B6D37_01765 [Sphingobacteriales bacterium UTBCD1]
MCKLLIAFSTAFFSLSLYGQQLSQVSFSSGSNLDYISFITDQGVLIRVSPEGKILEWGTELLSDRGNYYAPRLQQFMGRVEYYDDLSDSAFRGKVRYIGTCTITYYGAQESDGRPGKIRSIGTALFDYYNNFADKFFRGKIKLAGPLELTYFSSFDDELFRGKLRAIGNTPISYYSSFDDKAFKGKIKSIGSVPYLWYSSFDMRSGLKSGLYRQNVGSITFILR